MQWRRGLGPCRGVASRLASRLAEREGRRGQSTHALPSFPQGPGADPALWPPATSCTPDATSRTSQHAGPQGGTRGRGRGQHEGGADTSHQSTVDFTPLYCSAHTGGTSFSSGGPFHSVSSHRDSFAAPPHLGFALPRLLSSRAWTHGGATVTWGAATVKPGGATVTPGVAAVTPVPDAATHGPRTVSTGSGAATPGPGTVRGGADGVEPGAANAASDAQRTQAQAEEPEGAQGARPGEISGAQEVVTVGQGGAIFRRAVRLREVVIVGAARTAVGSFQGGLASFRAPELGGSAIAGALSRAGVAPSAVQEVILGNVLSAGLGQAPAKQAAQAAGVPDSAVCTVVNKVCSSGLKAVALGAQSIALGAHSVVVAGGMESMSQAPFLLPRAAPLGRAGDVPLLDSLAHDGLRDSPTGHPMGVLAQECVDEMRISREDQDEAAIASYVKALAAEATGKFRHEIVTPVPPVAHPRYATGKAPKHEPLLFDEELKKFDPDKLRNLPPAFLPDGSITAGNASPLPDGAAAVVLTSAEYAAEHGLPVMARILGWADAEQEPQRFPTSPSLAIPLALKMSGLQLRDAELFEINEAFAAVTLANAGLLGLQEDKVNVNGGAVALGHPIGASGARILVSLLTALGVEGEAVGVAAVCNGGGGASALVVQREPSFRIPKHEHQEIAGGNQ